MEALPGNSMGALIYYIEDATVWLNSRHMLFFEIYRWLPLIFAVPIASSWW